MKLTVLKKNLRDGLGNIEHAITESDQLPILKTLLLKTVGDSLQLCATNLEIGIQTIISGKIIDAGGIAIPFATFYSIISNLSSERIDLETKEQQLFITTDNYSATIQGFPETDFPIIPQLDKPRATFRINSELLHSVLSQVVIAAQPSEIRPELSGVLFDYQLTMFHFVATDSFRLAQKTLTEHQLHVDTPETFKVIVPLKTIQEILRIFPSQGEISFSLDQHQLLMKNNTSELISRIIDGDYPDYEQVIPKSFETELVLEKEYLTQALKLVSNFSSKINDVHFKLTPEHTALEVYSSHQYIGENRFLVPIKFKGEVFSDITFNWRYVLDGARCITSNELLLSLNNNSKPGLITAPNDASYRYVVMPIRTN
jgi:DNA polymerase III subunit beta